MISFLVNKSSTKEEFDKYHDSILRFIQNIKDKKLNDLINQPFKASKVEEPEDTASLIQPLDTLINNAKTEGFDNLFAKQNQLATGPTLGQGLGLGANMNSSAQNGLGSFSFDNISTPTGGSNSGVVFDFGTMGNSSQNISQGKIHLNTANSTPVTSGLSFPKVPEKVQPNSATTLGGINTGPLSNNTNTVNFNLGGLDNTPKQQPSSTIKFTPPVASKPQTNTESINSGITDLTNGASTSYGGLGTGLSYTPNKPQQKSNYSALDDFTLNDNNLGGLGNNFNLGGNQTGNLGLGAVNSGISKGLGSGSSGGFELGGMMGGLSMNNQQNNDTFGRGMGGLMINTGGFGSTGNQVDDPFAGLSSGTSTLGNLGGGLGEGLSGGMSGGLSNGLGSGGFNMGMSGTSSSGTSGAHRGINTMGLGLGGLSGLNNQSTQQQPKPGILSNPNLTVKSNQTTQGPKMNNFNEFDLL